MFVIPPVQQTNQVETMELDGRFGTRDDEEDQLREPVGDVVSG